MKDIIINFCFQRLHLAIEHIQRRKLNLMTAKGGFMENLGNPQETIADFTAGMF